MSGERSRAGSVLFRGPAFYSVSLHVLARAARPGRAQRPLAGFLHTSQKKPVQNENSEAPHLYARRRGPAPRCGAHAEAAAALRARGSQASFAGHHGWLASLVL